MRLRLTALALFAASGVASIAQTIGDERAALARARADGKAATARAADLDAAAARERDEGDRLRVQSAAMAARVQSAEAGIDAAEARIRVIAALRVEQRARLAAQQGPTVRLLAALQTMARRPPMLALMQPGSIADLVHVHALLAGVMPRIRARTAGLRAEVERGQLLQRSAVEALSQSRAAQADLVLQRQKLVQLETQARLRAERFASSAMTEQDRAIGMGEEARDIGDLIQRIGNAGEVRARLETLPGPLLRPAQPGLPRSLPVDTAVAASALPAYRLPVVGQVVTGLGEVSATGVRARGLTIATRPSAQVVAPTSGRVVYAAPFRGYGSIVVLDHGSGWTTLITTLAALDVRVGDQVAAGSPIGRAGSDRPRITVELRRRGEPIDIASLAG